jgi:hypothetical protein
LLKLFFGLQAAPETMIGFLEQMAESERRTLDRFAAIEKELDANRQYPDSPYWYMALRYGQIELEAHQRWAEETLAALHKLNTKQPASSETRKERRHGSR